LDQRPLDEDQGLTGITPYLLGYTNREAQVLAIIFMLLLLAGFFGLFAGLVFFSEGVIEPESKS